MKLKPIQYISETSSASKIKQIIQMLKLDEVIEQNSAYEEIWSFLFKQISACPPLKNEDVTVQRFAITYEDGKVNQEGSLIVLKYKSGERGTKSPGGPAIAKFINRHFVNLETVVSQSGWTTCIQIELNSPMVDNQIPGTAGNGIKDDAAAVQEFLNKSIPPQSNQTEKEIEMSYEQRISMAIAPRPMDLEEVANEITERGVSDFWGSMFIWFATQNGFGEKTQPIRILNLRDAILVVIGFPPHTPAKDNGTFKAFDQQMEFKLFDDSASFLIPIKDKKENMREEPVKEMETKQKIGEDKTVMEVIHMLGQLGASPEQCGATCAVLMKYGLTELIKDVVISKCDGIISFYCEVSDRETLDKFVLTETLPDSVFMDKTKTFGRGTLANGKDWFHYRVGYPEENKVQKPETQDAKMGSSDLPGDHNEHYLASERFTRQLEAAKLSEQSIQAILHRLFLGLGLKKPGAQSSLICTKDHNLTNVYYSHSGNHVTLGAIERTHTFKDGEVLSYGTGTCDAFFIIDTSNVNSFQEKMIYRHVGVPKVKLSLSDGYSVSLPFKKTYESVSQDRVLVRITCDALVSVSAKVLGNLTGPALTDLLGTEPDRYFIRGVELTEKVFHKRTALDADRS